MDSDYGKKLAQNLVEFLLSYEEELIQLERDLPAYAPLRRAVGISIAEACYFISDHPSPQEDLVPPPNDEANRAQ
ncbi:hypothetical protein [Phenylobacterium kunshanense]|uniref:Uncharacterized protein n=1 Tax=Phenylobacterium kunshanense TaxID=1445034 RepID=A0A328B9D6_9CAUL|nr:hypothetical protein [Phenylobacterium kunshanense]RAK63051.1 hypothetical protein DJ019_17410 [Phenylobacterium kunshanense]